MALREKANKWKRMRIHDERKTIEWKSIAILNYKIAASFNALGTNL